MKSESNFITLFRRLFDRLYKIEQKEWFKLQELSQLLLEDYKEGVLTWDSEIGYKKFQDTLDELTTEEGKATKRILKYGDELEKRGLDKNDREYIVARECLGVIESTISEILRLLVYYYPERLNNKPDLRRKIFERLQHSPNKGKVRKRLWDIAEKEELENSREKNSVTDESKELNISQKKIAPQKKLSIKEVALLLNYEGVKVERAKCNDLIKRYGHTSGDKLYNEFTHFSSLQNRKGNPGTVKKLENQIERIQNIIDHLSEENKPQALKELETLKSIKKEYL